MSFYKLEEAIKKTKDPLQAMIFKNYTNKNPFSDVLQFVDAETLVYQWYVKQGVAGVGRREVNGNLHKGTGSKGKVEITQLEIYNEVRNVDRVIEKTQGNAIGNGILYDEVEDITESIAFIQAKDLLHASIANGYKYNGLISTAIEAGKNFFVNDGAGVGTIDEKNVWDNLTLLQDEILGDNGSKAFIVKQRTFNKLQKLLALSGMEMKVATDNFGRPYGQFNGSIIIPVGSYVISKQEQEENEVVDLLPQINIEGDMTDRIVCATFGRNYIHGVRNRNYPSTLIKTADQIGPNEHPIVDFEDVMAIVDKTKGKAVSILEGVVIQ